jgi:hypothetical protein
MFTPPFYLIPSSRVALFDFSCHIHRTKSAAGGTPPATQQLKDEDDAKDNRGSNFDVFLVHCQFLACLVPLGTPLVRANQPEKRSALVACQHPGSALNGSLVMA